MKDFVKKLIERLEEEQKYQYEKAEEADKKINLEMISISEARRKSGQCFDVAIQVIEQLAEEYNNGWIPFKQREMDEEELRCIGDEFGYILHCKLPEEDEEILVTYKNGTVGEDIFLRDGNECYLDSGNDFVTEAIAWMPKPAPYQPKGE